MAQLSPSDPRSMQTSIDYYALPLANVPREIMIRLRGRILHFVATIGKYD